jgi:hypothetical protein
VYAAVWCMQQCGVCSSVVYAAVWCVQQCGVHQGSGMKKGLGTGPNRNVFYIEYR